MSVGGTWRGRYEYAPGIVGLPADFTLRLRELRFFRLVGTVQDDPPGMPEEGQVEGWVVGRWLTFCKRMPRFRVAGDNGSVPIAEWLGAHSQFRIASETPHPPLRYRGTLNSDGQSASGVWRLGTSFIRLQGGTHALRLPGCHGTWSVRRVE